jgi:blue copper oxidase
MTHDSAGAQAPDSTSSCSADRSRRRLLALVLATGVAPACIGRAIAAQPGAPLPVPPLLDADASAPQRLEAVAGQHEFLAGARADVLGYGQGFLGPALRLTRGRTARIDLSNRLDEPTTLHWHGLHVPGELDGGPHSAIAPGARKSLSLLVDQPAATYWYHAHQHGRTGPQVYAGLAGLLVLDDPRAADAQLPQRWGVDDLPLIIQDRAFTRSGQLAYSAMGPTMMDGFKGSHILVNGALQPQARVPAAWVRLRLLNGSNARIYQLQFEDGRLLHQIAGDAGRLAAPLAHARLLLAPGERVEVLVDFSSGGSTRLLSAPDTNGHMADMMGASASPPAVAEGGVFEVMRFAAEPAGPGAIRALPARLAGAAPAPDWPAAVRRRVFTLDAHGGMRGGRSGRGMGPMAGMGRGGSMGGMMTINARSFDMGRLDFGLRRGEVERWEVRTEGMAHPFHVHGTSFQVLSLDGVKQDFARTGWKDTVLVQDRAELLVRFSQRADRATPYMLHCHILEHEDAGMMAQFTVA